MKLEWYIDYYFTYFLYNGGKHHKYFTYMEQKYGEEWYEWIDKKFGWSTVVGPAMLFGKSIFGKSKNKLPFIFYYQLLVLYFIINN